MSRASFSLQMIGDLSQPVSILAVGLFGLMTLTWLTGFRINNYGLVDPVWSLSFTFAALIMWIAADGYPPRKGLLGSMVILWSLRLGAHLMRRFLAEHPREDGRYAELRRSWGGATAWRMFVFFQLQGLLVLILCAPIWLASANPEEVFSHWEWIGLCTWLVGISGESIADYQLRAFKSRRQSSKVCRDGLWGYSRHPNYFFEWLIWVSFAIFALGASYGWIGLLSPILILYFLLKVTGIPATEAQALKSRGSEYRSYQEEVSAFIPWFPKKPSTHEN